MEQYGDHLLRTAFLLLKDRHEAEDVVQESFVQAFHKIGQLKQEEKLKSWLTRIVVNRCRMKQRSWSWRRLFPFAQMDQMDPMDKVDFEMQTAEPGPEAHMLMKWQSKELSTAIHNLSYIYREAITLYYFNEMSVIEIAEELQLSTNTIKARLMRGRQQLKKQLEEEGETDESGTGRL